MFVTTWSVKSNPNNVQHVGKQFMSNAYLANLALDIGFVKIVLLNSLMVMMILLFTFLYTTLSEELTPIRELTSLPAITCKLLISLLEAAWSGLQKQVIVSFHLLALEKTSSRRLMMIWCIKDGNAPYISSNNLTIGLKWLNRWRPFAKLACLVNWQVEFSAGKTPLLITWELAHLEKLGLLILLLGWSLLQVRKDTL